MAAAVAGYAFAPQGAKAQSLLDATDADGDPLEHGGVNGGGDASGPPPPRAPAPRRSDLEVDVWGVVGKTLSEAKERCRDGSTYKYINVNMI